jgi:histidine phosphotransferase ChpT
MNTLTLTSLLITKFCHDLAGPLGGLQNGIEFLAESESSDAAELLGLSSSEASARLQIFRNAYGTFALQSPANAAEIEQMVHGFLKQTKLAANINLTGSLTQQTRSALLQQVLIAHQLLIYGGRLEISCNGKQLTVNGSAEKMHDDAEIKDLLMGSGALKISESATPKLIHALYWREYANVNNLKFNSRFEANQFHFTTVW